MIFLEWNLGWNLPTLAESRESGELPLELSGELPLELSGELPLELSGELLLELSGIWQIRAAIFKNEPKLQFRKIATKA